LLMRENVNSFFDSVIAEIISEIDLD
jgi:hypothetical protein